MKILQLGKFYPIQGGVEKVMYDLLCGFSKFSDIECDMMCVAATPQPYKQVISNKASLYCAKLNKKLFATMLSFELIKKLRIQCNDYDIIHIHHPDPMAAIALKLSGYRGQVVLHWHSDILKQKILFKLYRPLQNWLINRANIVVGTTPKYLEESPHLKGFNKKKIAVPIGIEPVKPDNTRLIKIRAQYKNKKIVFSLGRLVEYKGYEYLIDAAKFLPDDYVILIGGTGPLRDSLNNRILEANLQNKVKLLGRVDDADLPSYYGACDLFALSSIWKTEAFAIVQIEAMSCGKPIVATHIPESGVDWVNKDNVSGINVTPKDSKAFANAIMQIVSDEETYLKLSKGAKSRFDNNFTLDRMLNNCESIYRNLVQNTL